MNLYACATYGIKNRGTVIGGVVTVTYHIANSIDEARGYIYNKYKDKYKDDINVIVVEVPAYELCQIIISQKFTLEKRATFQIDFSHRPLIQSLADGKESYFVRSSKFKEAAKQLLDFSDNSEKRANKNYDLCTKLILEKEKLEASLKTSQKESEDLLAEVTSLREIKDKLNKENSSLVEEMRNLEKLKAQNTNLNLKLDNIKTQLQALDLE